MRIAQDKKIRFSYLENCTLNEKLLNEYEATIDKQTVNTCHIRFKGIAPVR